MTTIKVQWWLGNQMFQYAFIKALSLRNKKDFSLDISEYKTYFRPYELEIFNIEKKYANKNELPFYESLNSNNKYIDFIFNKIKWVLRSLNKNHYIEKQLSFDKKFLDIESWYIEWYFQTEKYFKDFENEIRKDFNFLIKPSKKNHDTIDIIKKCNSVSLHIRRWDFLKHNFHNVCSIDYYKKSIELIKSKIDNPIFFIFSDDINWAKENLKIPDKNYYIDWNNADTNYEDMRLMILCKHNIIANSSFSWRWAWLNSNNDKIVITPKKRSKANNNDRIPEKWLVL